MEREDLPLSVGRELVAAREAFHDQAALRRPVALAHDVLVRTNALDRKRESQQAVLLFFRERADAASVSGLMLRSFRSSMLCPGCSSVGSFMSRS
jgi:hypothetical protein